MPLTFLSHFHWLLSSSCGCPGLSLWVNVVSRPWLCLYHFIKTREGSRRGSVGGGVGVSAALGGCKCLRREDASPLVRNSIQAVWSLELMKRSLITVTANAKTSPVSKCQKMKSKGRGKRKKKERRITQKILRSIWGDIWGSAVSVNIRCDGISVSLLWHSAFGTTFILDDYKYRHL